MKLFVCTPFTQLFTISVFIRSGEGDNTKQVPLVYVFMLGTTRADYCADFTALLDQLPDPSAVVSITADFEVGMWQAAQQVLQGITINGCIFHHTQVIWRKIQSLSLQEDHNRRAATFCRCLMALAFLPANYIFAQFEAICCTNPAGKFVELLDYFQPQWLNNTAVAVWSVFGRPIKKNNDIKGWHRCINSQAYS